MERKPKPNCFPIRRVLCPPPCGPSAVAYSSSPWLGTSPPHHRQGPSPPMTPSPPSPPKSASENSTSSVPTSSPFPSPTKSAADLLAPCAAVRDRARHPRQFSCRFSVADLLTSAGQRRGAVQFRDPQQSAPHRTTGFQPVSATPRPPPPSTSEELPKMTRFYPNRKPAVNPVTPADTKRHKPTHFQVPPASRRLRVFAPSRSPLSSRIIKARPVWRLSHDS